ncbi:MAG: S8 family serine peptidase [Ruminococcus sp.]|nr:S8 family serine peptidase [Ruminococcus sp.]
MNKKVKSLLSAFISCIVSVTSIPIVLPISDTNAVTETTYQNITIEQLKSVQNFILGNSEGITVTIDKTFDVNNDDRIDVFDLCLLKKAYAKQIQKTDSFYSLSSEMIQDNDLKYGSSVMSDDFYSKRLIVKTKSTYDFSRFSPKSVISGFDNIYVIQFESYENAKLCLSALEKDTQVEYIELDKYMKCEELTSEQISESNSWGVSAIEADKYAEYLSDNYDSSVVVAVVDTGVSYHDFLKGRILDTGYDLVDNDPDPNDKHYHGTHIAGTVVDCTLELNVQIMPVRVLDAHGSGSNLNVGNGIRYATEHGADVINLSLGGFGCSTYINDSIEYAVENGVTVVVAAGNDNNDTKYYCPSHLENCIVVSACDSEYKKATFSNYGDSVDVTAPGVDILSCVPGGDYESKNGTSMATPHISAAAAMVKYADENATPAQIEQTLKDISLDLGDTGKDVYYGYGLPKLSKLINNDSPDVPIVASGQCGDNVYYTLDENGLLTISGTGDMIDNSSGLNNPPWYEFGFEPNEKIKKVVIKYGVTSIGGNAFEWCIALTSVDIPDSMINIGIGAFNCCKSLTSVIIPDSVTSIGDHAFFDCDSLKSVTIPDSVKSIGLSAFGYCDNLESIKILNPNCEISDDSWAMGKQAVTIYGYTGSTAQAYAENYNRTFVALD